MEFEIKWKLERDYLEFPTDAHTLREIYRFVHRDENKWDENALRSQLGQYATRRVSILQPFNYRLKVYDPCADAASFLIFFGLDKNDLRNWNEFIFNHPYGDEGGIVKPKSYISEPNKTVTEDYFQRFQKYLPLLNQQRTRVFKEMEKEIRSSKLEWIGGCRVRASFARNRPLPLI